MDCPHLLLLRGLNLLIGKSFARPFSIPTFLGDPGAASPNDGMFVRRVTLFGMAE